LLLNILLIEYFMQYALSAIKCAWLGTYYIVHKIFNKNLKLLH